MKWRRISEVEVEKTLTTPERIEDSIKERKNAFKHLNGKWLKITFKEEEHQRIVVTVIDKNR